MSVKILWLSALFNDQQKKSLDYLNTAISTMYIQPLETANT